MEFVKSSSRDTFKMDMWIRKLQLFGLPTTNIYIGHTMTTQCHRLKYCISDTSAIKELITKT